MNRISLKLSLNSHKKTKQTPKPSLSLSLKKASPARIATAMAFMALFTLSLLLHSTMTSPPPRSPQPASECVTELVMFSPCLGFVSSPPNNLSAAVSSTCCDAFSAALASASGSRGSPCLCYLLREPRMLGFPIDEARVLSLPFACALDKPSLETLCSGSEAMPPTDSGISNPPVTAPSSQPAPLMSLPPESDNPPPSLSPDSEDTTKNSSPPSEIADMLLPGPRSPLGLSTSASGYRFCSSKCWIQMSSLVFPFLFHTSL